MTNEDYATILDMFHAAVARRADEAALGAVVAGRLQWQTWRQLAEEVSRRATALASFGAAPGDRIVHVGPNSPDWIINDLAIHVLGAVHVPIHATLSVDQAARQVEHCGAALAVVADPELAARLTAECGHLSQSLTYEQLAARSDLTAESGEADARRPSPDALATILYTSGTTGAPRGVMLTHGNLAENARGTVEAVKRDTEETRLGFLPLSHIYARTCDLYCWIYRGTKLVLAESRDTIVRDCQIVRPTVINAVPYFYQKIVDRLHAEEDDGEDALRALLGGQLERCFCGGAGVPPDVDAFFCQRGLPVCCGYGLTEASPVVTATAPENHEPGAVGRPLPNVEVKLSDDGEIWIRGPSVMQSYLDDPGATHQAIRDGWLASGDLGEWTAKGNLRIVGRKKEIIVLATGHNIAPTTIEQLLVGSPLIEQAYVVGEGRAFLTALVVPNPDRLKHEIRSRRLLVWSRKRALRHPVVRKLFSEAIERQLAGCAQFEQIGAYTLIGRGFTLESGELTPKLSLRRREIQRNYSNEIDRMYQGAASTGRRVGTATEDAR